MTYFLQTEFVQNIIYTILYIQSYLNVWFNTSFNTNFLTELYLPYVTRLDLLFVFLAFLFGYLRMMVITSNHSVSKFASKKPTLFIVLAMVLAFIMIQQATIWLDFYRFSGF